MSQIAPALQILENSISQMPEVETITNSNLLSNQTPKPNTIYNQDCVEYLKRLPDKIIDCVILDPPYFNVVNEKWDKQWKSLDEYLLWIESVIEQLNRVSKYSCSMWLFGYAYQLGYIIPIAEKHGFSYRQHITINKGMKSVAGRTSSKLKMFPTATEYIIYFHKEARPFLRDYLSNLQVQTKKTSKEINVHLGKASNGGGTWSSIAGKKQKTLQYPTREDWDKLQLLFGKFDIDYDDYVFSFNIENGLTDVWNDIDFYDRSYKKLHPTQKPYKLIERLIKCSTNEGKNVLDVFMGSAMTAKVAKELNRNYYGCEIDRTYYMKNLLTQTH